MYNVVVENIYLLVIVTLISVLQNGEKKVLTLDELMTFDSSDSLTVIHSFLSLSLQFSLLRRWRGSARVRIPTHLLLSESHVPSE